MEAIAGLDHAIFLDFIVFFFFLLLLLYIVVISVPGGRQRR